MASLKDTSITGTLSVSGAPTFTTAVPVASGGTGATSASAALTNLGAQPTLVSGTNIKTVGGTSILGSGDIAIAGGLTDTGHSFTTNGYQKLSNGLIFQWGLAVTNRKIGAYTATFPMAFPNACFAVNAHRYDSSTYNTSGVMDDGITSITTTGYTSYSTTLCQSTVWMAIGY